MRGVLNGFSPLSLSPALWLDAADPNTIYDATTGGNLVAAGGMIARWEDKSGNGRHATQSASGSRPTRQTAVQNGRDVVRFDGSNDFLSSTVAISRSTYSVFSVIKKLSGDGSTFRVGLGYGTNTTGTYWNGWFNSTLKLTVSFASPATDLFLNDTSNGPHIFFGSLGSGTGTGKINGSILSPSTGSSVDRTGDVLTLGAFTSVSYFTNVEILEVIIFEYVVSTTNRQRVERYLGAKWGITVA